jgi:hypothetical protein
MVTRGLIPLAGGYFQSKLSAPPSCAALNSMLCTEIQTIMADWAAQEQANSIAYWQDMNWILGHVAVAAKESADLLTLPLKQRLMYLFAAVVALAMLSAAVLVGI